MIEYRFRAETPDRRRYTLHTASIPNNNELVRKVMSGRARDWYGKNARLVVESRTVTEWSETE